MDRLTLMKHFVQVVDSGSFSAAAENLGTTQSQVSKMLRMLEEDMRVTLFTRTTRKITLTEEGERLLPHCRDLMERYAAAHEAVRGRQTEPRGHIRLLTSNGLGRDLFMPYLSGFLTRYPHITLEHIVTDRKIDLAEQNIDMAIRMGELKDSSYKSKRIGLARRVTVASPAYLKKNGTPKTPEDLKRYNCILFTRLAEYTGRSIAWEYADPQSGKVASILVKGNYAADNSAIVVQAALDGIGIYQGPNWMFSEHIKAKRLCEILPEYQISPWPIYVLYPSQGFLPSRICVLTDYLAHEFSLNPWVADVGRK